MKATEIYLVRHGEAEWNVLGRYCGRGECALTEAGRRQAAAVAARFAHLPVAAVYSSPRQRARETAEPVARARGVALRVLRSLDERDYGAWDGRTTEEIAARWPELHAAFKADPARVTPPGGEACERVERRLNRVLRAIAERHVGQSVLVMSHKTAIRIFLAPLLGVALPDYYRGIEMDNAAATLVRFAEGAPELVWHNDRRHVGPC